MEKRVELVNDGIDKGDFNPTPGDWNCKGCGFFPVCRRRYVIR
ncbi:MAG: PD-(D/E)XK nuclease family protein [Spirochaetales bacterium]|nr:PD-(D/E)XK nuclease family protein [Spirochaetales bacterium]